MDRKAVEGYAAKLACLVDALGATEVMFQDDIKAQNHDDPINALFWRQGAKNGCLLFFLRLLSEGEREISALVFQRIKEAPNGDGHIDPEDYLGAALAVLHGLGWQDLPGSLADSRAD